jgi:hypothetical protein
VSLRAGLQLRSTACSTEVVVVRANDPTLELCCGGAPMVDRSNGDSTAVAIDSVHANGTEVGKRYVYGMDLEVLVTKAGVGSLSVAGTALDQKAARQLPASD